MFSIEYALRIYTNMANADESVDMQYFRDNMSKRDYKEFKDLIPFIVMLKSLAMSERFEKAFKRVNDTIQNYK